MHHILFISYDGLTDPLGQSQILPYLKGLTTFGYRFTILSSEKPERYEKLKNEILTQISGYPIKWEPLTYHKSPPVLSAIYDLENMKRKAKKIHRKDRIDMVHTRSGTPALAGLWLKKKFGIRFLNDVRDFYADSRVDSGQWRENNLVYNKIYKYFKARERDEISQSDGLVCLTNKAETIIRSQSSYQEDKPISVIPCSVDMNHFNPYHIDWGLRDYYSEKFNFTEEDIVFSYLGSIGTWYLTDDLAEMFKEILSHVPTAKFLFISPDTPKDIQDICQKKEIPLDRVTVVSASRKEVPTLLSLSSYSAFFIKSCYSKQASSPTKLGEIMAMGIPVITNDGVGDVTEVVEKYRAGIVLRDLCGSEYQRVAKSISNGTIFPGNAIRYGAIDYFSLDSAIEKYKEMYQSILVPEVITFHTIQPAQYKIGRIMQKGIV